MSQKIIAVNTQAARDKVKAAGRRVASVVSESMATRLSGVGQKLHVGKRKALAKLVDGSVWVSRKQLAACERIRSRYSADGSVPGFSAKAPPRSPESGQPAEGVGPDVRWDPLLQEDEEKEQ